MPINQVEWKCRACKARGCIERTAAMGDPNDQTAFWSAVWKDHDVRSPTCRLSHGAGGDITKRLGKMVIRPVGKGPAAPPT